MRRPSGTSTRCCRTRRLVGHRVMSMPSSMIATFRRGLQSHERLQQRRLARAVGAEHRDHLALVDRQRDAAHRMHAAVANVKIVHLKTHGALLRARRCQDKLR